MCVLFLLYWIETLSSTFYGKKNAMLKENIVSLSYIAKTLCEWDFILWRTWNFCFCRTNLRLEKPRRKNQNNIPSYLLQRFPVAAAQVTPTSSWDDQRLVSLNLDWYHAMLPQKKSAKITLPRPYLCTGMWNKTRLH